MAGLQWAPWVLSLGLGVGSFFGIVWFFAADELHQPRTMLVGHPSAMLMLILPPTLAFTVPSTRDWFLDFSCMTGSIVFGVVTSLVLSYCPGGFGAEPARRMVPRAAAAKAQALAEMFEAVAIWQKPTTAALLRHRQCRLRLLTTSYDLQKAMAASAFEWHPVQLGEDTFDPWARAAEDCRIALQLNSGMMALGFSPVSMELWYKGALGECLRRSCFSAAYALRSCAGRLAALGGEEPPAEVPAAPWLSSDYASGAECQDAAQICRKSLDLYLQQWRQTYLEHRDKTFRTHLEEVILKTVKRTEGYNPVQMFLKGEYIIQSEEVEGEDAQAEAFDEACRHSACLLGICQASTAAAQMAEAVVEESKAAPCCLTRKGFCGLRSWVRAPFTCSVWPEAFKKAKSFGLRMSFALFCTGLVYALATPNEVWPHKRGPTWTLVTVSLIVTPVQGASLQRALRRFLGTISGSIIAMGSILLVGVPDIRVLCTHIFLLAFGLKFFETELQYAGAVCFVTYTVVIMGLTDELQEDLDLLSSTAQLAVRRCCDVSAGVVITMVTSIFLAPDRAVDELRKREEDALRIAAKGMQAASGVLARAAARKELEQEPRAWRELRKEVWTSFEALNFAGDGRPGVGDVLEDARWESRWGVDRGRLVLGGLLWIPWCGSQPRGKHCLEVVVILSRLMRTVHCLISICESSFGEDAARPLSHDPRVLETLGPNGQAFNVLIERLLKRMVNMLRGQKEHKDEGLETEELKEQLQLLFNSAAASRFKANGLVGQSPQLGGMRAAAALKLLQVCVDNFLQIAQQLAGEKVETPLHSSRSSLTGRASHSSLFADFEMEEMEEAAGSK
ncbi:Aluminum-activated malate transporter 9 [Durusdinium trenchii]|uniref:Aluminum-activated malate transporter 9 n=1 Tax=Durusdinium trenchii TaxID=1381693 RepID=A0ABP0LEA5_9DINO